MQIPRSRAPLIALSGLFTLWAMSTRANNIQITNPTLTGNNGTTVLVQFDVTWENSWRGGATANWDAAWIFVKWKNFGNIWNHVDLSNTGFTAPAGSHIDPGLVNPSAAYDPATNPVVGIFIYRSANGNGTFTATGVQVLWNYASAGITYNDITKIDVFGTEMVYVPQGPFYVGDGASAGTGDVIRGQFAQGNTDAPFQITSEAALTLGGTSTANLGSHNHAGMAQGDDFLFTTTQVLPAAFPKGFNAFYCMKYEISQGQMVDFFNALNYSQQSGLGLIDANTEPGGYIDFFHQNSISIVSLGIQNSVPAQFTCSNATYKAFDYVEYEDCCNAEPLRAFLDWSSLRPMSELEYEKACRGPVLPVANEFAWGTTTIATSAYTTNNPGTTTEGIATNFSASGGNASYIITGNNLGNARAGIFAANIANTGRVTSGSTYYGIMEMAGNIGEAVNPIAISVTRTFTGMHGNGRLSDNGPTDIPTWFIWNRGGHKQSTNSTLRVSDRVFDSFRGGGRGIRTAP